jgi:ATP-dependent RNA helicase DDX24/MAK5
MRKKKGVTHKKEADVNPTD